MASMYLLLTLSILIAECQSLFEEAKLGFNMSVIEKAFEISTQNIIKRFENGVLSPLGMYYLVKMTMQTIPLQIVNVDIHYMIVDQLSYKQIK